MQSNKKRNIIKCTLSVVLPIIYLYVCFGTKFRFVFFIPTLLILSFIYIAPFFSEAAESKRDDITTVKPFIVSDLLYSLLPAICTCLAASIILNAFFDGFDMVWFFSPILMSVFLLLTLYFWLKYYINNKVLKKIKKPTR